MLKLQTCKGIYSITCYKNEKDYPIYKKRLYALRKSATFSGTNPSRDSFFSSLHLISVAEILISGA